MRLPFDTIALSLLLLTSTPTLAHPQPISHQLVSDSTLQQREADVFTEADLTELWKRKGGGGGGGKGGGGSSSSGSSSSGSSSSGSSSSGSSSSGSSSSGSSGSGSSSSGSSGSGSSSSSSGSSSSAGKGSSSSNTGGATKQGSGVQPSYGGGRYYGGGSTTPYRSGLASPLGIPAVFLLGSSLAFYPGIWAYGAYGYGYHNPYTFRNHSAANSTSNDTSKRSTEEMWYDAVVRRQDTGVNETKPVTCLCAAYAECGCDDNGDTTFLDGLIGDGSYAALNKTLIDVADINGTSTIVLNGTLANGTTTSGGTQDANSGAGSLQLSGYLVMIALVGCTVLLV